MLFFYSCFSLLGERLLREEQVGFGVSVGQQSWRKSWNQSSGWIGTGGSKLSIPGVWGMIFPKEYPNGGCKRGCSSCMGGFGAGEDGEQGAEPAGRLIIPMDNYPHG